MREGCSGFESCAFLVGTECGIVSHNYEIWCHTYCRNVSRIVPLYIGSLCLYGERFPLPSPYIHGVHEGTSHASNSVPGRAVLVLYNFGADIFRHSGGRTWPTRK